MMTAILNTLDFFGKNTIDRFRGIRNFFQFIYLSLRCTLFLPKHALKTILGNTISQIYFTGFLALPLITFIALATGGIVILQFTQLSMFSSQDMIGNILVVTIIRELGPLLTSLVVIARSGTAVASEVGSMKVNKEMDALRFMSIEPLSYLVFPRLVGGIVSLVCLAFYFNVSALVGGYFVASTLSDFSFSFFLEVLAQAISPVDFTLNLIKNSLSGLIIFSIACYEGFKVNNSSHEIPIATTNAVMRSIIAVVTFNLSITIYMFFGAL